MGCCAAPTPPPSLPQGKRDPIDGPAVPDPDSFDNLNVIHIYYPTQFVLHLYCHFLPPFHLFLPPHPIVPSTDQIRLHMDNIYVIKLITIKLFNYEQRTKLSQCINNNIHFNSIIFLHILCIYDNTKLIRQHLDNIYVTTKQLKV